jgi:hypothetical protein
MTSYESVKIESLDLTIEDLYKDFYTVPDFQREYVWESEQVEKLLEDVREEFYDEKGNLIKGPEYFLGSIVVCAGDDGAYQLIDGQQRMTTIYLVLCVLRDVLKAMGETPNDTLRGQVASAATDEEGNEVHKHRLILQYDDSRGILGRIVNDPAAALAIKGDTTSVRKILSAYQDVKDFLQTNFGSSPQKVRRFYAAFTKRVKLIRIKTPSLSNALKVFETVNDRGIGLNAMDLLKNLLFMKATPEQHETLKVQWKSLIDTLDRCHEKPLRFLRYYIMAHFELDTTKPLREDDIYTWISGHATACGLAGDPLGFLKELLGCSNAWENFMGARDAHGAANPYLKNLTLLSGAARQQYVLLLAGRHLPTDLFAELCESIENLFFCYIITREATRTFERNFGRWAEDLRTVQDSEGLRAFVDAKITPDLAARSRAFDFTFQQLAQSGIQQYRMRYILAKLTQFVERQAWGNPAHANLDQYIDSSVEIEHILPQQPTDEVRDAFDKPDQYAEYVEGLGNLTLLEKTINASVSNERFGLKAPGYKQSSFLLTKSLAEVPHVGVNTSLNRAVSELVSFDHWDSTTIEERQGILTRLARQTWGIPDSKNTVAGEPDSEPDNQDT